MRCVNCSYVLHEKDAYKGLLHISVLHVTTLKDYLLCSIVDLSTHI